MLIVCSLGYCVCFVLVFGLEDGMVVVYVYCGGVVVFVCGYVLSMDLVDVKFWLLFVVLLELYIL